MDGWMGQTGQTNQQRDLDLTVPPSTVFWVSLFKASPRAKRAFIPLELPHQAPCQPQLGTHMSIIMPMNPQTCTTASQVPSSPKLQNQNRERQVERCTEKRSMESSTPTDEPPK